MIAARTIRKSALLALLLFSQACLEDKPTEPEQARDGTIPQAARLQAEQLGEDPYMVDVAHEIPGFGGIYYDPPGGDRIVIAMAETATPEAAAPEFARAQEAVRDYLVARFDPPVPLTRPVEFVRRAVDYPFLELARHRARLRPHLFEVSDVVSLDVDESDNRIAIGISDESARAAVRDIARAMEIPLEMLSFHEESPAVPYYGRAESSFSFPRTDGALTLTDRVPDGKLQGGYEIASDSSACTLGFTALQEGVDPSNWFFVTNSHCSARWFWLDSGNFYQPADGDNVGIEYLDPPLKDECRGREGKGRGNCRWSDATLVRTDGYAPILPGIIGRPRTQRRTVTCTIRPNECPDADLEIDPHEPTFRITGIQLSVTEGEQLDKVGKKTGWTYGYVKKTYKDERGTDQRGNIIWKMENHLVDMMAWPGDSGSPVFRLSRNPTTSVYLVGILWGGNQPDGGDLTAVSRFANIEYELGRLDPTYKSWNNVVAYIDGPKRVVGPVECSWDAVVDEDLHWGPWTYDWSGILSGDERSVTGTPTSSGQLILKVTDRRGMSATDSLWVQVFVEPLPPGGPTPGCYDDYDPDGVGS